MKRKRLVIIIFSFLAAVIFGALLWPREREPEYDGLAVSAWIAEWADSGNSKSFVYAITQMGTNATPFLLRAVRYERPRWKKWLIGFMRYVPDPLVNTRCVDWLLNDESEKRALAATLGICALGRSAEPALPELRLLAKSENHETSWRALACIGTITNRVDINALLGH